MTTTPAPITTTLNRIRAHRPCEDGWSKLLVGLGKTEADDEPLPYARIVEINGLEDALWACRAEPQHAKEWRLFAVWCARQVEHLMTDQRSRDAIVVAERYANGEASDKELAAARAAARAAEAAAWHAAEAAAWAARAAARAAAWDARDAAEAAARVAAWAAAEAAEDAARDAARAAAEAAQREKFLDVVGREEPKP
jgi:hypothetical protein